MNKNVLGLFILCFALQGCMSTVTRLWNGGPYISDKERQAMHECDDEYKKINPDPNKYIGSKEEQDYLKGMVEYSEGCMKRKGF